MDELPYKTIIFDILGTLIKDDTKGYKPEDLRTDSLAIALEALKAKGVQLFAVSSLAEMIDNGPLKGIVKPVISYEKTGDVRRLMQTNGLDPEKCLYFGDGVGDKLAALDNEIRFIKVQTCFTDSDKTVLGEIETQLDGIFGPLIVADKKQDEKSEVKPAPEKEIPAISDLPKPKTMRKRPGHVEIVAPKPKQRIRKIRT